MSVTIGQIVDLLNTIAPLELAEEWDNVGLLVGDRKAPVESVLCALDFGEAVLDEAISLGVQMIVTHHPILFRARRNVTTDDPEGRMLYRLVRSGIALAAMHTNFDSMHPGVNDALAAKLGLKNVTAGEQGMCLGEVENMSFADFRKHAESCLGGPVRAYGEAEKKISRVAVLGGSGGDFAPMAAAAGADVYVTGEISYHKGLNAAEEGLFVLEAGHAATEKPAISQLSTALQTAANDVQYKVRVLHSAVELFL